MKEGKILQVKFIGDKLLIDDLIKISNWNSEFSIEQKNVSDDPYSYNLSLTDAATVITLISSGFYFGGLAMKLLNIIKKHNSSKITIQTPFFKTYIEYSKELSEEDIQNKLNEIVKVI